MKRLALTLSVLLALGIMTSCGDSGSGPDKPTAEEYVTEGWQFFSSGDLVSAETSFNNALATDSAAVEAYSGLGWIYARQKKLSDAVSIWEKGKNRDNNHADINAGLTVVYQAIDELEKCVASGIIVVTAQPDYAFQYDTEINSGLIHGLLASAYYGLQDYTSAAAQMDAAVPADAPHSGQDLPGLLLAIMDFLGIK